MAASDTPNPGDQTFTVADPEDYVQTRRLREIHDARERVPKRIREDSDRIGDDINRQRYNEIVTDALIDYIIQIEPLLRDEDVETEDDYWSEVSAVELDNGESMTIEDLVESSGRVDRQDDGHGALKPPEVRHAFRVLNRFLYDIGLDIEIDEGLPEDKLTA